MLYACDDSWWLHYFSEVATTFKGSEMWTIAQRSRDQFKLNWIHGVTGRGDLHLDGDHINAGLNSGHQAIALAYHFGASRILLLGYDMQRSGGRVHWHPDHPSRKMGNGGRFHEWAKQMGALALDLKRQGVEVINCSRRTVLTCYARATIEEALPHAVDGTGESGRPSDNDASIPTLAPGAENPPVAGLVLRQDRPAADAHGSGGDP